MTEPVLERPTPAVVTRPLLIGSPAPRFSTRTTMGERSLDDYRGRWLVFFSHPADFTPVCTSEFVAFSKAYDRFQALGCDLLALSVDSLYSHIAWVRSIHERFGVTVPFPITEDPSMAIAAAYGMIHPDAADSSTVRATFVIDPDGLIRAMVWYPMSTGRSVELVKFKLKLGDRFLYFRQIGAVHSLRGLIMSNPNCLAFCDDLLKAL